MTYGEFALLRIFDAAWTLPRDVIRLIIRHVNLRAKIAYRQRLRLPRYYNELSFPWGMNPTPYRVNDPGVQGGGEWGILPNKPYYGPGF